MAQTAGRLRCVLIKRGTNEASVNIWSVRRILGLHPGWLMSALLVEVGGLWARVNPYRNPLPLLCSPTPSATLALFWERNIWTGELRGNSSHTERSLWNLYCLTVWPSHLESGSFQPVGTVILALSTFSIHTAKQKQLMGGCASESYIPIGCRDTSNPPLRRFYWSNCDKSNKTRLFAVKNSWLANYTFRLVTRNCFDYFIG